MTLSDETQLSKQHIRIEALLDQFKAEMLAKFIRRHEKNGGGADSVVDERFDWSNKAILGPISRHFQDEVYERFPHLDPDPFHETERQTQILNMTDEHRCEERS